jgi:hypothetical protein
MRDDDKRAERIGDLLRHARFADERGETKVAALFRAELAALRKSHATSDAASKAWDAYQRAMARWDAATKADTEAHKAWIAASNASSAEVGRLLQAERARLDAWDAAAQAKAGKGGQRWLTASRSECDTRSASGGTSCGRTATSTREIAPTGTTTGCRGATFPSPSPATTPRRSDATKRRSAADP